MAKAKKLPSGSWRCLVYSHSEPKFTKDGKPVLDNNGKQKLRKVYESFTSDDPSPAGKREAERRAAMFAAGKEDKTKPSALTFGEALDKYIDSRENVLSPRTVMDYKRIRKNDLQELMDVKISRITQDLIQQAINADVAKHHSPKTVRNNHGLISAVLRQYRPDFALNTALPKKVRPELYIPSDAEIQCLMAYVTGTEMELPILLAAFGPMRRGEICALETSDIDGCVVHVRRNMILKPDHTWITKAPKSYAGDRYIEYPEFVAQKWAGMNGRITNLNPNNITDKFRYVLKGAGLQHFRFHDLRHYSASIQHALGIPDAYIMQRGGWGNDGVLKAVYRHAMNDKTATMTDKANQYFTLLCNTKCNTTKKDPVNTRS